MLGYDVKNGKMYVNEEGAEVVRKIFYKFVLERKSTHTIAKELLEEGIYPMRSEKWRNTVILRILQNEKYCGDLVQKKTFTPDYLSHEKKYNRGEEEFVIIKNHHVPIISREMFEKAEKIFEEKKRRGKPYPTNPLKNMLLLIIRNSRGRYTYGKLSESRKLFISWESAF